MRSLSRRGGIDLISNTHSSEFLPRGSKWVFVHVGNENNEVVRHEARLVAQGFTQRPVIVYDEICYPIMSGITSDI